MDAARLEEKYNKELEEMTDDFHAAMRSGKFNLEELQRLIGERSKEACAAADKFVRANPWSAVGIAVGVGCLAGFLLNSKR